MPTVGFTYPNLSDIRKTSMPNGSPIDYVLELLLQFQPQLDDMPMFPCNNGKENITGVRTAIPAPTWVGVYDYVNATKSAYAQYTDTTGMLEALGMVGERLLQLEPENAANILALENSGHIQGMSNTLASQLIYGNAATNPKSFTGLAPRFASLTAGYREQVINAGGTGNDNTSIWFVTWGQPFCHGIYPKGTVAGISTEDKGFHPFSDGNGGVQTMSMIWYRAHMGLAIRDPRSVVRIANLDVSDLATVGKDPDTSPDLYSLLTEAYHKLINPNLRLPLAQTIIYCNSTVLLALDKQARKEIKTGGGLTYEMVDGKLVTFFRGIPIKRSDAILNNEVALT